MCIGIFKPEGQQLPSKETLRTCFANNNDGAGFAIYNKQSKKWQVQKGFTKFKPFWKALQQSCGESKGKNNKIALHCRIGTSGKLMKGHQCHPDCTHPFPVSDTEEELFAHTYETPNIVVHNGVVGNGNGDWSDTMEAIKKYIVPLQNGIFKDERIKDIAHELLKTNSNKWLITWGADVLLMGDWKKDNEIYYSNESYKRAKTITTHTAHYNNSSYYSGHSGYGGAYRYPYSSGYAAADQNTSSPMLEISTFSTVDLTKFTFISKNKEGLIMFDWEKWEKFRDKHKQTKTKTNVEETTEIYDESGQIVIGLCDKHGNVIWDISDNDNDEADDIQSICPNCGEQHHIIDSSYNVGDSECLKCGAVFYDMYEGSNSDNAVILWNLSTRKQYLRSQENK
jgi:hypothetical protein